MPQSLRLRPVTLQRVSTTQRGLVVRVVNFAGSFQWSSNTSSNSGAASGPTYERVLRYPDGLVRRIRYPIPLESATASTDVALDVSEDEEWETRNAWKARQSSRQNKLRPTYFRSEIDEVIEDPQIPIPSKRDRGEQIPDSPLELLRYLTSDKHKQEQAQLWQAVKDSYQILDGCPWPVPKPLYLLAFPQSDTEAGMTYTLRTRIPLEGVDQELAFLLGRTSTPDAPFISCSRLVDGVVAFEDDADAESFGDLLTAFKGKEVSVARCDSHELFREVQSVKSVVVLLQRGCTVPEPHQLAAVLRGSSPSNDKGVGEGPWN